MDLMGLSGLDTLILNNGLYFHGGHVLYPPQGHVKAATSLVHVFDVERANMHFTKATRLKD